ncbi:hypothetical protein TM49_07760 [Martelella endophytica]|uniref:Uncharacterized protein n=1 Tax=Martelella endophytica TaxID=1486262 RepID=A0A0D5LNR9_MAREN|nr:hypothetical protein TM49_07760 [Martelella endophytica]
MSHDHHSQFCIQTRIFHPIFKGMADRRCRLDLPRIIALHPWSDSNMRNLMIKLDLVCDKVANFLGPRTSLNQHVYNAPGFII